MFSCAAFTPTVGRACTPQIVSSPIFAAGLPFIRTDVDPPMMIPLPLWNADGHIKPSPFLAAGYPSINTLSLPVFIRPECPAISIPFRAAPFPIIL